MDDEASAFAQLRSRFASLSPNGAEQRRTRENTPVAPADRRVVIGGRAGRKPEVRDAQVTFKVRPSQRAGFFRTAQGYGVTAVVLFEALISFAREHEAEFRIHLAQAMQRGRD
jgi:hypothetical protein